MSSDGNKRQFWKRNAAKVPGSIQHVYGAQHPPFDPLLHANLIKAGNKPPPATPGKPKKATTFQEFESTTSDAWDVGDDDDELLAMAAQNLNIEVVMETANKVIENHSRQQERQRQDDTTELEQREEEEVAEYEEEDEEDEEDRVEEGDMTSPEVSLASQSSPYTDSRLVKSHSEAPIGSPKDVAGEPAALHRQRSLPHRPPLIPLVARMADQNTSGTLAMTEREASRLDKFRQLLAGPNTDLVCSLSVCQLCSAFNDAVRGKVIQPSGHADYKKKKYHKQQKQMTGLCSNQMTGLYCLSSPRDFVCYSCGLQTSLFTVDFVSFETNFW